MAPYRRGLMPYKEATVNTLDGFRRGGWTNDDIAEGADMTVENLAKQRRRWHAERRVAEVGDLDEPESYDPMATLKTR